MKRNLRNYFPVRSVDPHEGSEPFTGDEVKAFEAAAVTPPAPARRTGKCRPHAWKMPEVGGDALECGRCDRRISWANEMTQDICSSINGRRDLGPDFYAAFHAAWDHCRKLLRTSPRTVSPTTPAPPSSTPPTPPAPGRFSDHPKRGYKPRPPAATPPTPPALGRFSESGASRIQRLRSMRAGTAKPEGNG